MKNKHQIKNFLRILFKQNSVFMYKNQRHMVQMMPKHSNFRKQQNKPKE